ncbi:AaceriABL095Wp [[Ashbya] aceris (nom. inval.)]|nr:AaceriABL095Wp [[Ashbya] aceris (nom. inval.)]
MSRNLADYFGQGGPSTPRRAPRDEYVGPSVSMAVEAEDDEKFQKATFNLKRTRSMGLLDEYISPTRRLLEQDEAVREPADDAAWAAQQTSPQLPLLAASTLEGSKSPPEPDTDSYMLPLDDIDVHHEPNRHVDYLSHDWEECDISQSWKYIILKKRQKGEQDLVNAARLENASWRTWAKARNNLRTVSPEVVNWSKDSDVTWLYGPILRDSGHGQIVTRNAVAEMEELVYGSDDEHSKRVSKKMTGGNTGPPQRPGPKPILKKRTVSEIIEENSLWRLTVARQHRKQMADANSIMDGYGHNYQHDDYDALAARVNTQYYTGTISNNCSRNGKRNHGTELEEGPSSPLATKVDNHSLAKESPSRKVPPYKKDEEKQTEYHPEQEKMEQGSYAQQDQKEFYNGRHQEHGHGDLPDHTLQEYGRRLKEPVLLPQMHDKGQNSGPDVTGDKLPAGENPQQTQAATERHDLASSLKDMAPIAPVLASILTSTNSEREKVKDRHIHFNDRVEQCVAVNHYTDDDYDDDNEYEEDGYDYEYDDYDDSAPTARVYSGQYDDESTDHYGSSGEEEEEEDGLFISATGRKTAENVPPIQTDASSYGSSTVGHGSRCQMHLIIKMLPATTLNYGSDDEYYDGDYYRGNAVSHNVNTYRGYDYVYDYNSVYTADTSNFLAFNNCDIVDVPEDLRTPVDEEVAPTFRYESPEEAKDEEQEPTEISNENLEVIPIPSSISSKISYHVTEFSSNSDMSDDSLSEQSGDFLSNGCTISKSKVDDENDSLALKRTPSLGKSQNSSLHDLQYNKPTFPTSFNFITGTAVPARVASQSQEQQQHHHHKQQKQEQQEQEQRQQQQQQQQPQPANKPSLVKRSSSKSFIFDDSDTEDSEPDSIVPPPQISHSLSNDSNIKSPYSIPTRNTSASTSPKNIPPPNFGSLGSGNSHASLNHVAIPGYISPRNGSMQSVISEEKLIPATKTYSHTSTSAEETSKSLDLDSVNKTFGDCRIGSPDSGDFAYKSERSQQQSSTKVMEMASKYLNSWKR